MRVKVRVCGGTRTGLTAEAAEGAEGEERRGRGRRIQHKGTKFRKDRTKVQKRGMANPLLSRDLSPQNCTKANESPIMAEKPRRTKCMENVIRKNKSFES